VVEKDTHDNVEPGFVISPKILDKLDVKHGVTREEVIQCFYNKNNEDDLIDNREQNRTMPPTLWFLAETNCGRLLKIVYVFREDNSTFYVKSAYEPNSTEIHIFNKYS